MNSVASNEANSARSGLFVQFWLFLTFSQNYGQLQNLDDRDQPSSMAQQARDAIGQNKLTVLADRGYFKGEEILKCERVGINTLVPKPQTSNNKATGGDQIPTGRSTSMCEVISPAAPANQPFAASLSHH